MRVVLLKDIKNLGARGDTCTVGDGYALNFLIPRKEAVSAVDTQAQNIARSKSEKEARDAKKKEADKETIAALPSSVTLKAPVNDSGKLFQAVTPATLEEHFKAGGASIPAQWFSFSPIKDVGTHTVTIEHSGETKEITLIIERE